MEEPLRQAYQQAGITERDIAIENVHLVRSTNSLEFSCTLSAPLPEERLRSFEAAMKALLTKYELTFAYTVRPAEEAPEPAPAPKPVPPTAAPVPPTAAVVVKKTNVVEADLPESGVLLGTRIPSGKRAPIHDLVEGDRLYTIEGRLVSSTLREGWGNKKENGKNSWRVQMNVTDFTDSVYCEATFFEEWKAQRFLFWLESARKKGKNFVLRGACKSRRFNPELNFYINDCNISATLSLQREAIANKPVVIEAAITGIGSEYSGDLLLYRVEGSGNNAQYTRLAGLQVERLERGETRNLTFTFTPKSTGTFKLVLDDKNYNSIATKSIQVKSGTTTSNPTYVSTTIQGLSSSKIYGSTVQVTAKFKNAGSTDFNGSIFVALADYTAGVYTQNKNINAVIPAGESKEISFQFDDLSINHKHQLFYFNYNSNYYSGQFTTQAGVDAYLSDGTKRTTAPAGTITVADNVLALDISKLTTVSKVVPNSNPNTLYIVNANKQPTGLDDKNVVKNNTTATLTLIDGYDFYSPIVFTATKASYTRTFDKGVHDEKGWSTFILPFDVTSVKQDDISLDWIPSDADVIKDFWLLEFVTDNNEGVTFDYAGNIKANTPYVIGVPDEKGANDGYRDLTNKPITFSADNAIIQAQSTTSATGDYFKFVGTMQSINDSVYVINTEGNCFDLTPMATVAPFRAYFVGSSDATATCLPIGISPIVTSITDHYSMPISSGSDQLYNLQGQRILQPQKGLYIKSGRIFKK